MNRNLSGFFVIFFVVVLVAASIGPLSAPRGADVQQTGNTSAAADKSASSSQPISFGAIEIFAPPAPVVDAIQASCSGTSPEVYISWSDAPGALEYLAYRDQQPFQRLVETEAVDSGSNLARGLFGNTQYCYTVRSTVADPKQEIGFVLSDHSDSKCITTPVCSGAVIVTPGSGGTGGTGNVTPIPTPTEEVSPTPSLQPTVTVKPTPPIALECLSSTIFNGKRVLNAQKFGSDGAAIQKALDCFKNPDYGGGAVYVPAGTYIVSDKIRVYSNVTLFGEGIDKTILQLHESMLKDEGGMLANDTNYGHKNIAVREMTIRGLNKESGINNCCPGILLRQLEGGFLDRIKVEGFSWHGIRLAYLKQKEGGVKDTVKNVRISNCQIINNKADGVAFDSPTSYSIVDHCTLSGNNHGTGDDKRSGAAIAMFMDEDGLVTKNKILNNTITANANRGISIVARNNITAIKTTQIENNPVCNNTVTNNAAEGIADGNSKNSIYIANTIIGNKDAGNGRVTTGSIQFYDPSTLSFFTTPIGSNANMQEDARPSATSPDCAIPDPLAIPEKPPIPTDLPVSLQQQSGEFNLFDFLRSLIPW